MNVQNIIVGIIVLSALVYIGVSVGRKIKSLSSKSACGAGCGCGTPGKEKLNGKVKI